MCVRACVCVRALARVFVSTTCHLVFEQEWDYWKVQFQQAIEYRERKSRDLVLGLQSTCDLGSFDACVIGLYFVFGCTRRTESKRCKMFSYYNLFCTIQWKLHYYLLQNMLHNV